MPCSESQPHIFYLRLQLSADASLPGNINHSNFHQGFNQVFLDGDRTQKCWDCDIYAHNHRNVSLPESFSFLTVWPTHITSLSTHDKPSSLALCNCYSINTMVERVTFWGISPVENIWGVNPSTPHFGENRDLYYILLQEINRGKFVSHFKHLFCFRLRRNERDNFNSNAVPCPGIERNAELIRWSLSFSGVKQKGGRGKP